MIESITGILESTPLTYKFAIILGVILVIAAICPPLISALVKQSIALTGRQAQALAAIGLILIVVGSSGLYMMPKPPRIIDIIPPAGEFTTGSTITVTVHASDPDKDNLIYEFLRKGPGTDDQWYSVQGPLEDNSWSWVIWPADKGPNFIKVIVYDERDLNKSACREYKIRLPNQPPKINSKSAAEFDGSIWKLETNASDEDGDQIEYRFSKFNGSNRNWDIICNWSTTDECYLDRSGNDAGKMTVRFEVRDHYHRYKIEDGGDHKMELKLAKIASETADNFPVSIDNSPKT
ncbi:hypothetical protein P0O24_03620 [Methanotrichaceae archaeon M04Ac]|uniref:DUF1616 domain-containing protein n=1 Tax=Candidatus Methanocrinis alkalitolerans TaxID=3033395 RepID=A0ABT5XDB2_9EURY|nr:hypothetical protein [Candidatus Methanocrinis alkalitolerans]MDF0592667.1 hypothetical protein [Candidatus Methanocrinis alkalitolerans]